MNKGEGKGITEQYFSKSVTHKKSASNCYCFTISSLSEKVKLSLQFLFRKYTIFFLNLLNSWIYTNFFISVIIYYLFEKFSEIKSVGG